MTDVTFAAQPDLGFLTHDPLAGIDPSPATFLDGCTARVEIPSVEGPKSMEVALETAAQLDVPLVRVSQGSGIGLLTDREIRDMGALGAAAGVEVSLFARPGAAWGTSAMARSGAGAVVASSAHGSAQLRETLDQVRRAADLGIRSVLLSDIGALHAFGSLRAQGRLPADMQSKVSVMLPVANPAAAVVVESLGASTINVPTDLSIAQLAELRRATTLPLDVYVEAPDNLGGFVRHHEIAAIVAAAAPVYVKFGLRNAPDIYPSGTHLESLASELVRARVHRARVGLDAAARSGLDARRLSAPRARGLAIPQI